MFKKTISIFLSLMVILATFTIITASANENIPTEKMLYIQTSVSNNLMQKVDVEVGETYYFTFGLTNNIEDFNVVCLADGDRYSVSANATQVSRVNKGGYSLYTYSLSIPSLDDCGNAMSDQVFFGICFAAGSQGYFFNASVYNANDANSLELLANPDFSAGTLDHWAWGWDAWFAYIEESGLSQWSNETVTLKVLDYNESLLEKVIENMLCINTTELYKELYQKVKVEAGETYHFTFAISSGIDFKPICTADDSRPDVNASIQLIEEINNGGYSYYTYSYTIPSTDASGNAITEQIFIGLALSGGANGYFFGASVYAADDESKTELLSNPDFSKGLDDWSWGWDAWFGVWNEKALTEWSNNTTTLKIVEYDESLLEKIPENMLYINTSEAYKELYQKVNVEAGKNYNFTFAVTSDINFTPICTADDARPSVDADIQLVEEVNNGYYKTYTYSYTIPSKDVNGGEITEQIFFGLALSENSEGYFFNASVYLADDKSKSELFANPDFSKGLDEWSWGWDAWFGVWNEKGLDEWSNQTTTLKVVAFDEDLLYKAPEKMLYIKATESNVFMQRASVKVGETYYFTFSLSNSIKDFNILNYTDNDRYSVSADVTQKKKVDKGNYSVYTYSITIPVTDDSGNDMTELVFFGINFSAGSEGYLFDTSVYNAVDKKRTELFNNPDFSSGEMAHWAWGWEVWFGTGDSEWNSQTATFKVMDYNKNLLKNMLHIRYESLDMTDDVLIQKIENIEADVEYTVSFSYHFVSGKFNEAINFCIIGDDGDPDTLMSTVIGFSDSNDYIISSSDDGVNIKYTFTLDSETIENYEAFYAGFGFNQYPKMITELYVADLTLYKTDDFGKNNILGKNNFYDMSGWYSYWASALEGSETFGSTTVEHLDYIAKYVSYDAQLFMTENDVIHYGDINFDGEINLRDLVALKKNIANLGEYISNLDCNKDGVILADDLTILRKHLIGSEPIIWEDDGISSLQKVDYLSGGADSEALTLRNNITANTDTIIASNSGKVYYVSENGEYSNSGLKENDAINIEKLRALSLSSGDTVLFKRKDVFRIDDCLTLKSGVSYGAYGEGNKPEFLCSLRDYADNSIWTTKDGYLWQTYINADNAVNIVFNGGEYIGVSETLLSDVDNDGEFYFDSENRILYLYLRQYNPAHRFDSIEISSIGSAFACTNGQDITIENICVKYAAIHAMNLIRCKNIRISGCEIGWIGGEYTSEGADTRYGNGIQFWAEAANCEVINNYFYQIFDAAVTFQGTTGDTYSGLTFKNNLIEYTSMNFEFWDKTSSATISNIDFTSNILRFAGYGFGGMQRANKFNQAFILGWNYSYDDGCLSDFNITENIFDVANCYFFYATNVVDSINISANKYYQNSYSAYSVLNSDIVYADNQEVFEAAVKEIDSEAVVTWLDN